MLKKLMKYEMRATGRAMLGVYLAVLLAAAALGMAMRNTMGSGAFQVGTAAVQQGQNALLATVLVFVYAALVISAVVLTVVHILQRFDKNILGPEGYLTNTLPVSSKQLILSKALSAMLWVLLSALVSVLSMFLLVAVLGTSKSGFMGIGLVLSRWREIVLRSGLVIGINVVCSLAETLLGVFCGVLCIYTAILIGHQFKNFRVPAGIAAFFVMNAAQSWLAEMVQAVLGLTEPLTAVLYDLTTVEGHFSLSGPIVDAQYWMYTAVSCGMLVLFCAVYFFAADWMLRTRLNLE